MTSCFLNIRQCSRTTPVRGSAQSPPPGWRFNYVYVAVHVSDFLTYQEDSFLLLDATVKDFLFHLIPAVKVTMFNIHMRNKRCTRGRFKKIKRIYTAETHLGLNIYR